MVQFLAGVRNFCLIPNIQTICGASKHTFQWLPELFPQIVKLTTYVHLVPRFRMSRAIPPLSPLPSWHGQGQLHLYCIQCLT